MSNSNTGRFFDPEKKRRFLFVQFFPGKKGPKIEAFSFSPFIAQVLSESKDYLTCNVVGFIS